MASLPFASSMATTSIFSSHHRIYNFPKPPPSTSPIGRCRRLNVRSRKTPHEGDNNIYLADGNVFNRRNVLLGVGGLSCGGAAANILAGASTATPISAPDISKCSVAINSVTNQPVDFNCCPPVSPVFDYELPRVTKLRLRPAAHLAGKQYWEKYERAISLMKALPADDPRSFQQQANVHCTYCCYSYDQAGDSDVKLQIHGSWLFFPWHRWYLYFFERILAKLIGDDSKFGLPFWNWDNPSGMAMPEAFAKTGSSLYDAVRNLDHFPPAPVDLNYFSNPTTDESKIVKNNLSEMYREMVRNAKTLEDFYGARYVTGDPPEPQMGTVEIGSHNSTHIWVGQSTGDREDMGNFATAGRDPIFFSHHGNIDRLWSVWRDLRTAARKPSTFRDPNWLDASFVFYDENARLVRVKVSDALDPKKMGYTFQKVDLPWLKNRPPPRGKKPISAATPNIPTPESVFPAKLDKVVKVLVTRPKKSRSAAEKDGKEELLVVEGIEVAKVEFVKFDVFVSDEEETAADVGRAEYAGTYTMVPRRNAAKTKSKIRVGLNELLEDLGAEDEDKIVVSLVPRAGGDDVTIAGIRIVYVSNSDEDQ